MTDRYLGEGRYRIDGLLGRGGMSEVHHGWDERLDRPVAIKMLRPPTGPIVPDSPEAAQLLDDLERDRKRFLREIRTTARLEHPGIPAVHDTGVDTDDRLWLVMQLLRGTTLEAVLAHDEFDPPPPVGWAAAITAQIAAVLADVHRHDVVHRDIKPANVMITDGGLVKVLDFGIAILRGTGALPRLTQVDKTVGTPPYMSPEQSLGKPVTAASDVYSLGCLLHELLTGDPPFVGGDLRIQHVSAPPPAPRAVRADVPAAVDTLVVAMLAKQPDARPTARDVYEALAPFAQAGTGDEAGDRDPTRPFRRPLLAPPPARPNGLGHLPVTERELGSFERYAMSLLDDGLATKVVHLVDEALRRTGTDPFVTLRLRHLLGAALYAAGEYSQAAKVLSAVSDDYRNQLGPGDLFALECALNAGDCYAELGRPEKALPLLLYYVRNADDPAAVLQARYRIAQMYTAVDRRVDAISELAALRGDVVAQFGPNSTQVRNLDRTINRLTGR